jgi:uncharacterized protein (DUF302 family)
MDTDPVIIEKVSPWDFEKTVEFLIGAATKMNWTIPAIHDLQQSLAKAGKIVKSVKVLEICNTNRQGDFLINRISDRKRLDLCGNYCYCFNYSLCQPV